MSTLYKDVTPTGHLYIIYLYIYISIYIYIYIYIYEGYQQQLIAITPCFTGWTQSSDGSTIQYLSVLKTKTHENCVTNFEHEYWIF